MAGWNTCRKRLALARLEIGRSLAGRPLTSCPSLSENRGGPRRASARPPQSTTAAPAPALLLREPNPGRVSGSGGTELLGLIPR